VTNKTNGRGEEEAPEEVVKQDGKRTLDYEQPPDEEPLPLFHGFGPYLAILVIGFLSYLGMCTVMRLNP
jgi:hypothetical protein